jgi:hypothetical protein
LKDPGFDVDLVVSADARAMARVWTGAVTFAQAVREGDLRVEGPPRPRSRVSDLAPPEPRRPRGVTRPRRHRPVASGHPGDERSKHSGGALISGLRSTSRGSLRAKRVAMCKDMAVS